MSGRQNLVAIGKIVGGFGLEGMMKVLPLTHSAERFTRGLMVWLGMTDETRIMTTIREIRTHGTTLIIGVDGIQSRSEVDAVRGNFIFVDEEQRMKLPDRTWFIDDIIGMNVVDEQGTAIGSISGVLVLPAHHVYVVRRESGEVLIPAIPSVVLNVDTARRTMVIHVLEGLLEANTRDGSKNEN